MRASGHGFFLPVTALSFLCLILFLVPVADVMASPGGVYHQVETGESLDSLALKYRVPVYEIAKANRVKVNDQIHPGSRIYIPGGVSIPVQRPTSVTPVTRRPTTTASPPASRTPTQVAVARPNSSAPPFAGATPMTPGSGGSSSRSSNTSYPSTVKVRAGDTLWGIANRYDLTVNELASANNLNSSKALHVGTELKIPSPGGSSSTTRTSSSTPRTAPLQNTGSSRAVSSKGYSWPVEGRLLRVFEDNSRTRHFGIDIEVPGGTGLQAVKSGKVVYVGKIPAYGRMVIVNHSDNMASCYAFCSEVLVRSGQSVSRGDIIARSGDPERSDSPYFHFQLRKYGDAVNPLPYLP